MFLILYSGTETYSHSYSGWEVGYFDHVRETSPGRTKIAFYLDLPPKVSAEEQGISLGLATDILRLPYEEFEHQLVVHDDDPICLLIKQWQSQVADVIEAAGFTTPARKPEQDSVLCVRNLKLAIFRYLKDTVETIVKPQKQVAIRVKGSTLAEAGDTLPSDAEMRPMGAGTSMAIFGLADEPITWQQFADATQEHRLSNSWQHAIPSVVMSSFPDRLNVDNSQVILSTDEAKAYRVILTTATKYYNDWREFSLYFVETVNRADYGDSATTILLKGLQLVCRFRFLFLEVDSEFSAENIMASRVERLPDVATRLLKELNFLRKDAQDAGLDVAVVWRKFVTWDHINKMSDAFQTSETKLRVTIRDIIHAREQLSALIPLQRQLSSTLGEMEKAVRPENSLLLQEMAEKLGDFARRDGASSMQDQRP